MIILTFFIKFVSLISNATFAFYSWFSDEKKKKSKISLVLQKICKMHNFQLFVGEFVFFVYFKFLEVCCSGSWFMNFKREKLGLGPWNVFMLAAHGKLRIEEKM